MRRATDICNPAWAIWIRVFGADRENFNAMYREWGKYRDDGGWRAEFDPEKMADFWSFAYRLCERVIDHMSFAIPDPHTLDLIARQGPILEIGAGTGYWAWCLRQMGVDVLAFDHYPPQTHPRDAHRSKGRNAWFDTYWTRILRGDERQAARYPERALMMVWPYMDSMAIRALKAYRGNTVIYVGEERAACATAAFFDELDARWEIVEDWLVPQWPGLHDGLWILKRKE